MPNTPLDSNLFPFPLSNQTKRMILKNAKNHHSRQIMDWIESVNSWRVEADKAKKQELGFWEEEIYIGGLLRTSSSESGRFIERAGFSSIRATNQSWIQESKKKILKNKIKFTTASRNNWQAIETVSERPTLQIDNPSVWLQRKQRKKKIHIFTFPKQNKKWKPQFKKDKRLPRLTWVEYILYCGYNERTGMKASISFIFYTFSRETNRT